MSTLHECPSCAAQVDFPAGQISALCTFCESPLVAATEDRGEPVDLVAPFDLDRRAASGRLKQFLSGHFWAPEAVRKESSPEELTGILVPFWVYDATARSTYRGDVGIWWYETQTYTVVVNGRVQTRTRQVRRTEWHGASGSHVHTYIDHLVSGSRGLPEAEANELEPFDLGKAVPFTEAMVAGVIAERPSVSHSEARQTAADELAQLENRAIRKFLPGDEVRDVHNETKVDVGAVRLVLLPVWIATFKHKGKVIRLLVNGQTGEVIGQVPKSWFKIIGAIAIGLGMMFFALMCMGIIGFILERL